MITCYETESHSWPDWLAKLNVSEREFLSLIVAGVLVPAANERYVANFVGCFITDSQYCVFLPKYCREEVASPGQFQLIASALRRYWAINAQQTAVRPEDVHEMRLSSNEPQREYDLYCSLHRRFLSEGLYTSPVHIELNDARQRINWAKTIASKTPIHSNDSCIYESPLSVTVREQANLATRLHASTLLHLNEKYRGPHEHPLKNALADKVELISRKDLVGNRRVWTQYLRSELAKTFNSDDIQLLNGLLSYLDRDHALRGPKMLTLFGTNSFHVIWEAACSHALQNQNELLANKLSQPSWTFYASPHCQAATVAGGKQRPDFLAERQGCTLMLDAKYHYPLPHSLCGWGDLVKQHFYYASYESKGNIVVNGLLFPDPQAETLDLIGHVSMRDASGVTDQRFKKISIFKANPRKLLYAFAHNQILHDWVDRLIGLVGNATASVPAS